jgi:class 3 adenylate cyclase
MSDSAPSKLDNALEGERRQVTIIFADISGFTALNDAAKTPGEVEAVVRLINLLLQTLSEAIYEFDGHIDKYIGDEIMAIFGAPKAHEDDPERALRAVLSMQERLKKFNQNPPMPLPEELGIHGGVSTGTVIAGWFGTERTRSYTVMGDAVNVASRLEGASERGEFLISESTSNLVTHLFDLEERQAIQVKGKRDPLKIYNLKGVRSGGQPQPPEAPIIGRDVELNSLLEQYNHLKEKQGGIVIVSGEAGLGKSRLISEFRKQVDDGQASDLTPMWLYGRGLSYRQSFKNRLLVDILYSYLELPENPDDSLVRMRLEAMGEKLFGQRQVEVVPYLATLLGISLKEEGKTDLPLNDPQMFQQRTFLAMGQWVETLVAKQPLIMVFEDLHWADPSSVELIEYLFSLTVYHPLLIICVTRPERESNFWEVRARSSHFYKNQFTELALWPLSDAESRQLIKGQLKIDHMAEGIEHLILRRAEGNPLFLEEVLRSLIEEGAIAHTEDGHWEIIRSATEIHIPDTLQGVLNARIDRLTPHLKEILQIAAVIGRIFPYFILAANVEKPTDLLKDALNQLGEAGLIKKHTKAAEPEYIFKHVLTHEIVYSGLLHEQRKAIHKRIADFMAVKAFWMLGEQYAPIVANHYYKSETWPRALRYFQRAAEAAIQSFANKEAISFYTRALEVSSRIGSEADQNVLLMIYEGRAKIHTRLGDPEKAIADYEAMLTKARDLKDDSAQMRALNGLGLLQATHYSFPKASKFFHDALTVARRIGDQAGTADTLNHLGHFYTNTGQLKKGSACFQEARAISTTLQDEARRIESEDGLAKIMLEQGQVEASLKRYQNEIITVRQRLGFRNGLMSSISSVLMAQIYVADYESANKTAEQALDLHQRSGDLYRMPIIKYYQAFGQIHQGEFGAAGENLREGLQLAKDQGQKASQVLGLTWLSYYDLNLGLNDEGLQLAEEAVALADKLGSPLYELRAKFMLGSANRHFKQTEKAIHELESVQLQAKKMGLALDEAMILYQLARAHVDAAQWDEVEKFTRQLLTLAHTSSLREFIARGQWIQSLVDIYHERYDAAIDTLIEASNLAEETDSRLSQYLIQIQKSYVYYNAGNDAASRDAVIYAQKIQKRLIDSLSNESYRQIFLNNLHSRHLAEMVEANLGSHLKIDA